MLVICQSFSWSSVLSGIISEIKSLLLNLCPEAGLLFPLDISPFCHCPAWILYAHLWFPSSPPVSHSNPLLFLVCFFKWFYWSIANLQCHVSFWYTAKWLSYICVCVYIYTHTYYFPLWFITGFWIWIPVLYSRALFIILYMSLSFCICYSLHLVTLKSNSLPLLYPLLQVTAGLFSVSVSLLLFLFFNKFICVIV